MIRYSQRPVQQSIRQGSVFHVYLIYIVLTGMLLSSCGVCLKLLLQSGKSTDKVLLQTRLIEDVQRRLRKDFRNSTQAQVTSDTLTLKLLAGGDIVWKIQQSHLIRTEEGVTEPSRADFRFQGSDRLFWSQQGGMVQLGISEGLALESAEFPLGKSVARSKVNLRFRADL